MTQIKFLDPSQNCSVNLTCCFLFKGLPHKNLIINSFTAFWISCCLQRDRQPKNGQNTYP